MLPCVCGLDLSDWREAAHVLRNTMVAALENVKMRR